MRKAIITLAAVGLMGVGAQADHKPGGEATKYTLSGNPQAVLQEFVDQVHEINSFVIRSAEIGEQRAKDPRVKEFAANLVKKHREGEAKLAEFAKKKGMAFTERSQKFDHFPALAAAVMERNTLEKLQTMNVDHFDMCFMGSQIGNHQWARAVAQSAEQYLPDREGREWAKEMLRCAEEHLQHAERLAGQLHKDKGADAAKPAAE